MKNLKRVLIGLAMVTLAGCSTRPASQLESQPAEPLTVLEPGVRPAPRQPGFELPVAPAPQRLPGYELPVEPPPALSISSTVSMEPAGRTRLSEVRFVTVAFTLRGSGAGEVTVVFFAPGGTAYEQREAKLKATPFEAQRLEFIVPVAGTSIDTGHMAGTWTAMLYLNGSEAASSGFELTR